MAKSRTTSEEFVNRLKEKFQGAITSLDSYTTNLKKIRFQCNKINCGHTWETTPATIMKSKGCPKCTGSFRRTHDDFAKEVEERFNGEYSVIGTFISTREKVEIQHNNPRCGFHRWSPNANNFLRKTKCPKCNNPTKKFHDDFIKELEEKFSGEYTSLETYINNHTKILFRHNNESCNYHEFYMKPNSLFSGQKCLKCQNKIPITTKDFKQKVKDIHGDDYEVLGEYITSKTYINIKHNEESCGYFEFKVTPNNFLDKRSGCPKCASSKGEKRVSDFLKLQKKSFQEQHRFDDCRYKKPLPFDFAIFSPDNTINCLVEYDGEQHFKPIECFGGEEGFKQCQRNDQIKNDYCSKNNIPLIRISYKQFDNIETILEKELTALGIIGEESIEPILG